VVERFAEGVSGVFIDVRCLYTGKEGVLDEKNITTFGLLTNGMYWNS
jgi:hypothetical protein